MDKEALASIMSNRPNSRCHRFVENAFRFLELPANASNDAIKSKYKQLDFDYHLIKCGNMDDWVKLQISYDIIKVSRETDDQIRASEHSKLANQIPIPTNEDKIENEERLT